MPLPAGFSPVGVAMIVGVAVAMIAGFYVFLSGVGAGDGMDIPLSSLVLLVAIVAAANMYSGAFGSSVTATINNLWSASPEVNILVDEGESGRQPLNSSTKTTDTVPENPLIEEVFHIPSNTFTYPDAKAVCTAYGGRLATYKEVESAYNRGADWCSYGWSEGQMALFPTQYKKWEYLQGQKGHEHDCGRPGINGGYIDNPAVKFGINCYGHKPLMTQEEADLMSETPPYPKTQQEIEFDRKVDHWRHKLSQILVAPFNSTTWSVF